MVERRKYLPGKTEISVSELNTPSSGSSLSGCLRQPAIRLDRFVREKKWKLGGSEGFDIQTQDLGRVRIIVASLKSPKFRMLQTVLPAPQT